MRDGAQQFYDEARKAAKEEEQLDKATTIEKAIDFFADTECPHCRELLILPSLEDIQNWLEENEQ